MYSIYTKQKQDVKSADAERKERLQNHEAQTRRVRALQKNMLAQNYYARVEDWLSTQHDSVQATGALLSGQEEPPMNPDNMISFRPPVDTARFLGSPRVSANKYVHELERVEATMKKQQESMPAQLPYHPPQANEMRQREKCKEIAPAFKYTHRTEHERINRVILDHNLPGETGMWHQPQLPEYRPHTHPAAWTAPGQPFRNTFVPLNAHDKAEVLDPATDMSSVSATDRWYGPLRFEDMMRYPLDPEKVAGKPPYRTGVKLRLNYQSMAPDLNPPEPEKMTKSYWNATKTIAYCNYTETDPKAVQGPTIWDNYTKTFPDKTQTARELTKLLST